MRASAEEDAVSALLQQKVLHQKQQREKDRSVGPV